MKFVIVLLPMLALSAGALIPFQAAANAALSHALQSVAYAALVLFTIGLLFTCSFLLLQAAPLPKLSDFLAAPSYGYLGGCIVAIYVLSITYLAPRLGVGNAIIFIVTGQIIASALIDHYGLLGAQVATLTGQKIAGLLIMVLGLFLAKQ
jgi:bacterial/archaeal transporter family-2 protein